MADSFKIKLLKKREKTLCIGCTDYILCETEEKMEVYLNKLLTNCSFFLAL